MDVDRVLYFADGALGGADALGAVLQLGDAREQGGALRFAPLDLKLELAALAAALPSKWVKDAAKVENLLAEIGEVGHLGRELLNLVVLVRGNWLRHVAHQVESSLVFGWLCHFGLKGKSFVRWCV
jgi:hypothetical protein